MCRKRFVFQKVIEVWSNKCFLFVDIVTYVYCSGFSFGMWSQLAELMSGGFRDVVDHFEVIDCRYPYEYEGGHVSVSTVYYIIIIISSTPKPMSLLLSPTFRHSLSDTHTGVILLERDPLERHRYVLKQFQWRDMLRSDIHWSDFCWSNIAVQGKGVVLAELVDVQELVRWLLVKSECMAMTCVYECVCGCVWVSECVYMCVCVCACVLLHRPHTCQLTLPTMPVLRTAMLLGRKSLEWISLLRLSRHWNCFNACHSNGMNPPHTDRQTDTRTHTHTHTRTCTHAHAHMMCEYQK